MIEHGGQQSNLVIRPFQPYERLSEMFASADVGITLLNGDAGVYSVPSKLLSYLCAGRPVVAAVPAINQAAKVIEESGAGRVVAPDDGAALASAVAQLLSDSTLRDNMGKAGRSYAENHFNIEHIGDQFMEVIETAVGSASHTAVGGRR